MSTRGGIGYVVGDGVIRMNYQHYDSYPSKLGQDLLARYGELDGDVVRMRQEAVDDHPGGWAVYLERCFCHDPAWNDDEPMTRECRCPTGDYTHCDALFIEWLYVLNTSGLDVYKSAPTGQTQLNTRDDGFQWHSQLYRHVFVTTLPWDADSDAIGDAEERGHQIHEAEWEKHGRQTVS